MKLGRRSAVTAGPPNRASLHEAALGYLARYAATASGVRTVLNRRIDRWTQAAEGDRDEIRASADHAKRIATEIVADLVRAGAINDAAFAASRAHSLARSGRSGRAITAHLRTRGVAAEMAAATGKVTADDEVAAALSLARRRRIGPFRIGPADAAIVRRETGILARAGFPRSVVLEALDLSIDAAEARIRQLRSS